MGIHSREPSSLCSQQGSDSFSFFQQFGMEVKLQTKISCYVPDRKVQSRCLVLRRTTTSMVSIDELVNDLEHRGWVVRTRRPHQLPTSKQCASCQGYRQTRRYFAHRQWKRSSPICKHCTKKQVQVQKF